MLDTFHDEPLPPMSSFYDLPNVIVTPHTAWSSGRVLDRSVELFCDNLRRFAAGEPLRQRGRPERRATDPRPRTDDRRRLPSPMQIAIVGLAGSGKTTVFNTLTRGHAETGGYGGVTLNVGVVKVPDDAARPAGRDLQAQEDRPGRRHVRRPAGPAAVDRGPRRHRGAAGRPPRAAARLRRAAPRRPRVRGPVQPAPGRQRRPGARPRAARPRVHPRRPRRWPSAASSGCKGSGRHGTPAEREAAEREEVVLRRIHEGLEAGTPIRDLGLDTDDEKAIRGFRFLTQKPVLVLLNVGEGDLADGAGARRARSAPATTTSTRMVDALSAKIEMELGELEPDEAAVFMEELGIAESRARTGSSTCRTGCSG